MVDITPARVRELLKGSTRGPWRWFGNVDVKDIYLGTPDRGRLFVMQFRRWGMQGAQPRFQARKGKDADYGMVAASEGDMPIYEVSPQATERADPTVYRGDITGLRHPDAELMAAAPEIAEAYLELAAKVERVAALADKWEHGALRWADPLPVPPEVGLIREALAGMGEGDG